MRFKKCYRCGKTKLAVLERGKDDSQPSSMIEMVQMGWGKHVGQFRCKNCKEEPKVKPKEGC